MTSWEEAAYIINKVTDNVETIIKKEMWGGYNNNYVLKNIKIFNGVSDSTKNFKCGFRPNIVMVIYNPTSAGYVLGWYASIIGLNITVNNTIHRHTAYSEESGITINSTGFSMNRYVGGDNGTPAYAIALNIEPKNT